MKDDVYMSRNRLTYFLRKRFTENPNQVIAVKRSELQDMFGDVYEVCCDDVKSARSIS